jgi:hypothetical protein
MELVGGAMNNYYVTLTANYLQQADNSAQIRDSLLSALNQAGLLENNFSFSIAKQPNEKPKRNQQSKAIIDCPSKATTPIAETREAKFDKRPNRVVRLKSRKKLIKSRTSPRAKTKKNKKVGGR